MSAPPMFHLKDNLYFGRLADGSVRIVKFRATPMILPQADQIFAAADVLLDVAVPAYRWVSVVSSMTVGGETTERFEAARRFHDSDGRVQFIAVGSAV